MEMVLGGHLELHLLQGCYLEAERAERVALHLTGLRNALPDGPHTTLFVTTEEIRVSGQLLRELAECSQIYLARVPIVLDYLEILLPCISKSLRDITTYYEDRTLTKDNRWRKMYHSMTEEAGGLSLPERFIVYNRFLTLLRELLTRSPNFDFNIMESTRLQIMQLREARGIPPPPIRLNSSLQSDSMLDDSGITSNIHWAEKIFSLPLPSRTALKHQQSAFNEGQITLIVYQSARERCPYFLLRTFHMGSPWFSLRGAHELCVEREKNTLQFWRWSPSDQCSKPWANLCFMTWEVQLAVEDLNLRGERKLFQARITDDRFMHSLIVYEDTMTKGLRLHAAVWDGDLRQSPVWTAFVTHQSASPKWIKRVGKTKIRLADIQLYVFCQEYRQQNQRNNSAGAFEIRFVSEEATKRFKELLSPPPTGESTTLNKTLQD
ncbi:hypothetical protein F66182_4644 [Fusarium sp. NRRL 66182]|nr:hypothetical protein F66182_4644 [Fusarium sp. NRRL 66182]